MRVLFVYKYLTLGGVEAVIRARLERLPSHGVEARAWFLRDGPGRFLFGNLQGLINIGGSAELHRFLQEWEPDLVSSIDTEEVILALDQASHRPPLIVEIHSPYRENRVYVRNLKLKDVSAFFVPSRHQAELVRAEVGSSVPIVIVTNSLSEIFTTPLPRDVPSIQKQLLGWVGRLDELKDWKSALEVAVRLRSKGRSFELVMVGEPQGALTASDVYKQLAVKELADSFRWFRSLPFDRMPTYYDLLRASNGALLCTSRDESLGMVVVEAMARGCAVVAPNQPPLNEYVTDGESGLLFQPGDLSEASERLELIMRTPTLRGDLGKEARARALALFGPDRAVPYLVEALQAVLAGRTQPS